MSKVQVEVIAALRIELDATKATLAKKRTEVADLRDCGQDVVCRFAPGCQRHFLEHNGKLVAERDDARAERDALTKQVEALNARAGHFHSCGLELNNATREAVEFKARAEKAERDLGNFFESLDINSLNKALSDTRRERDSLRERLGDAERVIETLRGNVRPLHSHKCWQTLNHLATNCTCGAGAIAFALAEFDAKWGGR